MSEHLPAPDINPDDYFCDICGDAICPGIKIRCHSCEVAHIYIIEPLKARIKALEGNRAKFIKNLEGGIIKNKNRLSVLEKNSPEASYCQGKIANCKFLKGMLEEM